MAFDSFSKEMYALAEKNIPGGRYVAPGTLTLVVVAIAIAAAQYIFDALIRLASLVGKYQGGSVGWLSFFALGVGVVLAMSVLWLAIRGQIAWVRAHTKLMDVKKADDDDFQKLRERVAALESHTDISGIAQLMLDRSREAERAKQNR